MTPLILIDAGHGGMIDGKYVTPGKRGQIDDDERVIYEGLSNRAQAFELQYQLSLLGIASEMVFAANADTPLQERVTYANRKVSKFSCLYVSIHSNAFSSDSAHGWEIFVSANASSTSKEAAKIFMEEFEVLIPEGHVRRGAEGYKVENFFVLRHTRCPAVLIEDFFMTNPAEFQDLTDPAFRMKLVDYKVKAIQRIANSLL